jgi:hypothetical protein
MFAAIYAHKKSIGRSTSYIVASVSETHGGVCVYVTRPMHYSCCTYKMLQLFS